MAADQQFCLRWNNHQSTLISVFDTLLENGTLVDCTLAAEGQYLKAHKVVLSACSPYMETLLSQNYDKHPILILKDVKFTELKSMMDYMYRGEVNISQDQLGTFLKAAESLQIKGLSENGEGDARDVGSTNTNPPPPRRPPATRPEPEAAQSPAHRSRDGSVSPSSRKRRRLRRNSDDGDNHIESNSCDVPAQSTPVPNIPASITTTPIRTPIVKPEVNDRLDHNTLPAESGLLKEKIEPAEPLLEPKTEYLEDLNNDDSVEDLTLDDDDEMDMSQMSNLSNMSRPGPSHGADLSNQGFPPWQLGNQSGTDEVFMAAQEAVNAHRDSQDNHLSKNKLKPEEEITRRKSPESDEISTVKEVPEDAKWTIAEPEYLISNDVISRQLEEKLKDPSITGNSKPKVEDSDRISQESSDCEILEDFGPGHSKTTLQNLKDNTFIEKRCLRGSIKVSNHQGSSISIPGRESMLIRKIVLNKDQSVNSTVKTEDVTQAPKKEVVKKVMMTKEGIFKAVENPSIPFRKSQSDGLMLNQRVDVADKKRSIYVPFMQKVCKDNDRPLLDEGKAQDTTDQFLCKCGTRFASILESVLHQKSCNEKAQEMSQPVKLSTNLKTYTRNKSTGPGTCSSKEQASCNSAPKRVCTVCGEIYVTDYFAHSKICSVLEPQQENLQYKHPGLQNPYLIYCVYCKQGFLKSYYNSHKEKCSYRFPRTECSKCGKSIAATYLSRHEKWCNRNSEMQSTPALVKEKQAIETLTSSEKLTSTEVGECPEISMKSDNSLDRYENPQPKLSLQEPQQEKPQNKNPGQRDPHLIYCDNCKQGFLKSYFDSHKDMCVRFVKAECPKCRHFFTVSHLPRHVKRCTRYSELQSTPAIVKEKETLTSDENQNKTDVGDYAEISMKSDKSLSQSVDTEKVEDTSLNTKDENLPLETAIKLEVEPIEVLKTEPKDLLTSEQQGPQSPHLPGSTCKGYISVEDVISHKQSFENTTTNRVRKVECPKCGNTFTASFFPHHERVCGAKRLKS